jgi:hypothetical protein
MRCDQCDAEVPSGVIASCWESPDQLNHRGICCSCFDVAFGRRPPVVLGLRTAASLYWPDDISEIR